MPLFTTRRWNDRTIRMRHETVYITLQLYGPSTGHFATSLSNNNSTQQRQAPTDVNNVYLSTKTLLSFLFFFLETDSYFVFSRAITSACSLSHVFSFFVLVFQSNREIRVERKIERYEDCGWIRRRERHDGRVTSWMLTSGLVRN